LEAIAFRLASRYEPALEGLTRAYVTKHMIDERKKCKAHGIEALVNAAVARLTATDGKKEKWSYTKKHSIEVGFFAYVMAREAQRHGLLEGRVTDQNIVFIGGLLHDIGKTFLPTAIVVKELGVEFVIPLFKGDSLTDVERRVLRYEHIVAGTTFERLFGSGPHIKTVFDMTGLHHVSYNGLDNGAPSYPSLLCGKDLPFHSKVAKTADFISAVVPRHYRKDNLIQSTDEAIAYAVSVAGIELDPLSVSCLLTGLYDISLQDARGLIRQYVNPEGQLGVSNLTRARFYAKELAEKLFSKGLAQNRATARISAYVGEAIDLAKKYGTWDFAKNRISQIRENLAN